MLKTLCIFVVLTMFYSASWAWDHHPRPPQTQQDDGYTIYDKNGRRIERLDKAPFQDDLFYLKDKNGNRIGTLKKEPFSDDWTIRDKNGNRKGTIKRRR